MGYGINVATVQILCLKLIIDLIKINTLLLKSITKYRVGMVSSFPIPHLTYLHAQ